MASPKVPPPNEPEYVDEPANSDAGADVDTDTCAGPGATSSAPVYSEAAPLWGGPSTGPEYEVEQDSGASCASSGANCVKP